MQCGPTSNLHIGSIIRQGQQEPRITVVVAPSSINDTWRSMTSMHKYRLRRQVTRWSQACSLARLLATCCWVDGCGWFWSCRHWLFPTQHSFHDSCSAIGVGPLHLFANSTAHVPHDHHTIVSMRQEAPVMLFNRALLTTWNRKRVTTYGTVIDPLNKPPVMRSSMIIALIECDTQ